MRTGPALTAVGAAAVLVLAGCGGSSSSGGGSPSATPSSPSASATPTPSAHASPTPSAHTSPTPSARTTPPSAGPWKSLPLTVYYIAIGDNGRSGPFVGCGDSAVATYTAPVRYTEAVGPSMRALLANHKREIGQSGLINVLDQSRLTYRGYTLRGSTVTVYLTGTFQLAGECDIPRAKAEIEYTALKAAHATKVVVYIDRQTIDQRLSLR